MTDLMCLPNVVEGGTFPVGWSRKEWKYRGIRYCVVTLYSHWLMWRAVVSPPKGIGYLRPYMGYMLFARCESSIYDSYRSETR